MRLLSNRFHPVFFWREIIVQLLLQILVDAAAGYGLPPSQSFYFLLWASRRLYCHNHNNNNNNNNINNNNNNKDHQAVLHTSFVPGDLG